jgi:hypothetical protein
MPAPPPPKPPGFLRVLVEPWAEVWIDGKLAETTPFAKALSLPEGEHEIVLKNPHFAADSRKLSIKRGATETLKVSLVRK